MNTILPDTILRNAARVGSLAAAMLLHGLRFLRQTLLYTGLAAVAAVAWFAILQPRWLVDDGAQNCAPLAPKASQSAADRASGNQPLLALDATTIADQTKVYNQCLAHNEALADPSPLTRAGYERLVARGDAAGWQSLRFFMVFILLVGVGAALVEGALRRAADPGFSVRTDRRRSGPRVIDDLSYPSVYRSNRQ